MEAEQQRVEARAFSVKAPNNCNRQVLEPFKIGCTIGISIYSFSCGTSVRRRTMVELGAEAERHVELTCESEDALVLFCHGAELQESVVAYGPFVMNTEDEIREAYAEYQADKFGRV